MESHLKIAQALNAINIEHEQKQNMKICFTKTGPHSSFGEYCNLNDHESMQNYPRHLQGFRKDSTKRPVRRDKICAMHLKIKYATCSHPSKASTTKRPLNLSLRYRCAVLTAQK